MTDPLILRAFFWNSSVPKNSMFTSFASKVKECASCLVIFTPKPSMSSIRCRMSRMAGRLSTLTAWSVRSVAHRIWSASFFAPWGIISPLSLFPPMTWNVSEYAILPMIGAKIGKITDNAFRLTFLCCLKLKTNCSEITPHALALLYIQKKPNFAYRHEYSIKQSILLAQY